MFAKFRDGFVASQISAAKNIYFLIAAIVVAMMLVFEYPYNKKVDLTAPFRDERKMLEQIRLQEQRSRNESSWQTFNFTNEVLLSQLKLAYPPNNRSYPLLNDVPYDSNSTIKSTNKTLTIVFWSSIVGDLSPFDDLPVSYYSDRELRCNDEAPRCFFTKAHNELEKADIVFFGFSEWYNNIRGRRMPPESYKRPANQLWIFYMKESPAHSYHWDWQKNKLQQPVMVNLTDYFNLTMTYRLDSDIVATYGRFKRRASPDFSRHYDRFKPKTKTAVFMASNCNNRKSHREDYVSELVKSGLDVEVIGRCDAAPRSLLSFKLVCKRTDFWSTRDECSRLIGATFKFYLAFENSLCTDYITEKFYRAASIDTIPVVLNSANMSRMAPPHSYIDAKDFENPRELAEFLNKVGSNEKLYNSYFAWKPWYDVEQKVEGKMYKKSLCNLCEQAHEIVAKGGHYIVQDIDNWWTKGGNCVEGQRQWNKTAI